MSGDSIHMDYYSVLGPIDPQVRRVDSGVWVPALGYLVQYERLIEKAKKGDLTTAEMTFLIEKFDPAELYRYEQEKELSISLLKDWLVRYKFKSWITTRSRRIPVTKEIREARANDIATELSNIDRWHSHGRGISMEVLRRDLKLEIDDFGENKTLDDKVECYHRLLTDYILKRGDEGVVHTNGRYTPLRW